MLFAHKYIADIYKQHKSEVQGDITQLLTHSIVKAVKPAKSFAHNVGHFFYTGRCAGNSIIRCNLSENWLRYDVSSQRTV